MSAYNIIEDPDKMEIETVSSLDELLEIVQREVLSRGGESKAQKARKVVKASASPDEMLPMPGTPDFCEFLMDGAV